MPEERQAAARAAIILAFETCRQIALRLGAEQVADEIYRLANTTRDDFDRW